MKIVFMGTPEFSVPSLKRLIKEFEVKAVFTQPDRPKGRGKKIAISPVKEIALKYKIPVYQPLKIKEDIENINKIKEINPDFIIVVAFGQILPKEVLDIPKYGCINLHASLLPKYRGAAPINWAIIKGDKKSGNTTMFMEEGLDTGDMLLKSEVKITEDMTAGNLHDILMEDGGELLVETIKGIISGDIKRQEQKESESTYVSILNKKMGLIDWKLSNIEINNLIRGLNPWPMAYTHYKSKVMKIYEAKILHEKSINQPGYIVEVCKKGIKVECGEGRILIEKIQFPGNKPMRIADYINGHKIEENILLK